MSASELLEEEEEVPLAEAADAEPDGIWEAEPDGIWEADPGPPPMEELPEAVLLSPLGGEPPPLPPLDPPLPVDASMYPVRAGGARRVGDNVRTVSV